MPTFAKHFESQTIAVTTTRVEITCPVLENIVRGFGEVCCLEIDSAAGGVALSNFIVQLRDHPDGEYYDYLADTDFDNASIENLKVAFGATDATTPRPHRLATGDKSHIIFALHGANSVKFLASVASGSTDVTVRGTIRGSM